MSLGQGGLFTPPPEGAAADSESAVAPGEESAAVAHMMMARKGKSRAVKARRI